MREVEQKELDIVSFCIFCTEGQGKNEAVVRKITTNRNPHLSISPSSAIPSLVK